jgi:TP901 family phage tail tape measure protein
MTNNFQNIGLAGVAAIGIITIAFKKAISVFAETEQGLANVKAVSNATAAEFKELEEAASDAGTTTRFTAKEAADALFFLSSAGLSATESVSALDGVLELAGATGSGLAQSAQTITSTLSQFSLAASDAAKVSNIFAAANSNSQATLDKLQGSLRQVGPVAAGLSIGLEEVVGSLQALFNAGFQGESAGRALKSALADLANEASPTIAKLEALGVSFESVNPEVVGLTGAIGSLEKANLSTAQVIDAFGKVAGPQLVTLIRTGEAAIESYTEAVTGTNEAARQYAVQNDTLSGSIDSLKSATEGAGNSFIATLAPAFRAIIDLVAGFLRLTIKIPKIMKGAGAGAAIAATGFLALSKALAIVGVTLSTGPLALITGLAAVGVGLSVMVAQAKEVREVKLAEEFGDLARELGLAGQAIDDFTNKAGEVEAAFRIAAIDLPATFQRTVDLVKELSEELDLTEDQIINVAITAEKVTDEYKAQLIELQRITAENALRIELNNIGILQEEKKFLRQQAQLEAARAEAIVAAEALEKEREREASAARLADVKKRLITLDKLALEGAITETTSLEEKKALREEEISLLLDQALVSGEVTNKVIDNIERQKTAIENYNTRLAELAEEQEGLEENRTFSLKEQFKQQILAAEARDNAVLASGQKQREQTAEEEEEAQEAEEENSKKKIASATNLYSQIASIAKNFFSALVDLSAAVTATQIEDIEKLRDADVAAIDARTEALLESLGIAEETQIESLERRLAEAIAIGELETANELDQELQRTVILANAEDEKTAVKEKADKKARKLNREQAERERALASFNAGVDTASAVIGFLANPGGLVGVGLSIAAVTTGAIQIAAINSAPLPALQTGGIVLPQSGGTAAVLAENGSPELALNAGSEGEALLQQFASKIAAAGGSGGGSFVFQLVLDGRKVAESTVRYINNGLVKLEV